MFLSKQIYNEINVFSRTGDRLLHINLQGDPFGLVVLEPGKQALRTSMSVFKFPSQHVFFHVTHIVCDSEQYFVWL